MLPLLLACTSGSDSAEPAAECAPLQITEVQAWTEEDLPERITRHTRPALALGDFDGDGWLDAFFGYADGSMFLWNDGTGQLTPGPTGPFDLSWPSASTAAVGDIDNDGDLDLYLGRARDSDHILVNDGGRSFTLTDLPDSDEPAGSGAFGDLDGDGRLDLVVGTMPEELDTAAIFEGTAVGPGTHLYRQQDGGLVRDDSALPEAVDAGMVWQVSPIDADGDGDLDLYIAHDFGPVLVENQLLLNDGTGRFSLAEDCFCDLAMYAMGIAVGDANTDGQPDLYITDIGGPDLLVNEGGGSFYNGTAAAGATIPPTEHSMTSWGTAFVDADRDGCQDIAVVLGNLGSNASDIYEHVNPDWVDGEEQPDVLLRSDCAGGFAQAEGVGFDDPSRTVNLAVGDLNRDGRPDLVTAGRYFLRHWRTGGGCETGLTVDLGAGGASMGAKVAVTTGDRTITQWLLPGTTHGTSAPELYFGLGGAGAADSLTVQWMDGTTETHTDLPDGAVYLTPPARR